MSKKEVVKASGAIQMTNKVSLLQRRTWNILLANAFDELVEFEEHQIEVKQLIHTLDFGSKNEDHLKSSLKELTTTAVEWNILRKDKSSVWGVTTLLSQVEIKDGICTYAYSPALKKKLFQPSMYAKINLSIQNRFDSKHSLALYELCIDYYDVKRKRGETPYISVEDFRRLMGIDETEYAEFKYLNKRTISEPIDEINEKSDVFVEVEYKRQGRKVAYIKFVVTAHQVNKEEWGKLGISIPAETEQVHLNSTEDLSEFINFLSFYHVGTKDIQYFIKNIPFYVLQKTLTEIKEKINKKIVHYPKSYILTVLNTLISHQSEIDSTNISQKSPKEIEFSKESIPTYLAFLIEEKLLDLQKGTVYFPIEDKNIYINSFLEYAEDFWIRVKQRFYQFHEQDLPTRFESAFREGEREEDFIHHPLYQILVEKAESKKDYIMKKLNYLSLIINLYWKIIEKELTLDDAIKELEG